MLHTLFSLPEVMFLLLTVTSVIIYGTHSKYVSDNHLRKYYSFILFHNKHYCFWS